MDRQYTNNSYTSPPRSRGTSDASTSSTSSTSSTTSISKRRLVRDCYKRPWQILAAINVPECETRAGTGMKSPYPLPGRRNLERV